MRIAIGLVLLGFGLVTAAEAKAGGWYCLLGFLKGGVNVQVCQRTEAACEADRARNLAEHPDWDEPPKPCFHVNQAAAFTVRHKKGGRVETIGVPQMEACKFIQDEAAQSAAKGDVVSKCQMRP